MTRSKPLHFKRGEIEFQLWRITDEEYRQLREHSLPIKEDGMFMLNLMLFERDRGDRLTLPKAFLALEKRFGRSSTWFDDWKCSFSYPLLLVLRRTAGKFYYMLRIGDYRGSLEFPLYRVLEAGAGDYDVNVYHNPFELEFSREEINEFMSYLYGFIAGYAEATCKPPIQPFLKHIDSNHILYGYRDGEFFEEEIESESEYQAAIAAFKTVYETEEEQEDPSDQIRLLLQTITGDLLNGNELS